MYLCIKWWGSPPRTFPFDDATTLHTRRARNSKTADALFVVRQASFSTNHMIFLHSSVSCSQSPTHVCKKSGAEEEVGEHSVHSKVDAK